MKNTKSHDSPKCLVSAVADALQAEPALEAVKIDRHGGAVSVATLGPIRDPGISEALESRIQRIAGEAPDAPCDLLQGKPDCSSCSCAPEQRLPFGIVVRNSGGSTTISRATCPTAPRFWTWKALALPKMEPREMHLPETDEHADEWKLQLVAAGLCGLFGILGWLTAGPLSIGLYAAAYVAGGWFALEEIWKRLQKRVVDIHFLMVAVAAGSASIGAWGEGAVLLFLFSLSGALEHYAMGRTQKEISSLFKTAPKTALVLEDGHEVTRLVEELNPGMRLLIKPGDLFPVDAELVKGETAADESNLTGEAVPVEKAVGDTVLAGTINLWGVIEAVVLRSASESALQKIIRLIREAQHMRAPSQRLTDKFGTAYTYAVILLSLAMFLYWWKIDHYRAFASTSEERSAFYRAMTLLVVSSPCALVLSIPSAILAAIAWAARRGILFRGGAAVEKLARIDVVAMDKTGTLTTGELQVASVESFPPGKETELFQLAYSLEKFSTHPLARAITRHGKNHGVTPLEILQFESVSGLGLKGRHDGKPLLAGRREWLAQAQCGAAIAQVPPAAPGFSEVWICAPGLTGRVLLRDDIRPQARSVVDTLRAEGLHTVVLTGDRAATAERLKEELGLDEARAELKPREKVEAISGFVQSGRKVAMIGDGVNDAPSLAAADVGVAMGARGSDSALEQADIILMHDRLENFLAAFELSRRARRVIYQNLTISLGTVCVLVILALFGKIPLTIGVLGHEGSTVVVVANALRLLVRRKV